MFNGAAHILNVPHNAIILFRSQHSELNNDKNVRPFKVVAKRLLKIKKPILDWILWNGMHFSVIFQSKTGSLSTNSLNHWMIYSYSDCISYKKILILIDDSFFLSSVQFQQQLEHEKELRRAKEETIEVLQGDSFECSESLSTS